MYEKVKMIITLTVPLRTGENCKRVCDATTAASREESERVILVFR